MNTRRAFGALIVFAAILQWQGCCTGFVQAMTPQEEFDALVTAERFAIGERFDLPTLLRLGRDNYVALGGSLANLRRMAVVKADIELVEVLNTISIPTIFWDWKAKIRELVANRVAAKFDEVLGG